VAGRNGRRGCAAGAALPARHRAVRNPYRAAGRAVL